MTLRAGHILAHVRIIWMKCFKKFWWKCWNPNCTQM